METEMQTMGARYADAANRTKRAASGQYAGYNPTLLHPNAPTFQECPGTSVNLVFLISPFSLLHAWRAWSK